MGSLLNYVLMLSNTECRIFLKTRGNSTCPTASIGFTKTEKQYAKKILPLCGIQTKLYGKKSKGQTKNQPHNHIFICDIPCILFCIPSFTHLHLGEQ